MANRQDIRSRLSIICCVFGIILVLIAIVLVTLSFVKPLWTPWGRAEYSRNVLNAYDNLFKTEAEALREMGLPDSCTSNIENRTITTRNDTEETHEIKRWVCPGTTKTNTTGTVTRRKRYVGLTDYDQSCATHLELTQPRTITRWYGVLHVVKHLPGHQFVQDASCGSWGLCSRSGRSCRLHTRLQPLLVSYSVIRSTWELRNAVYNNKVWFEEYEFPGSCKCT